MSRMLAGVDERQIKRRSPLSLAPMSGRPSRSTLSALGAIALWALLATFGVALSHLPPFLLTGLGLIVGSLPGRPRRAAILKTHADALDLVSTDLA